MRFLKSQDARGAAQAAEGERLRRLRERVEAQESKLRRLRALRGQVDLQKTYNVTLSEYMAHREAVNYCPSVALYIWSPWVAGD